MRPLHVFLVNLGSRQPLFTIVAPPLGIMYLAAYLRSKLNVKLKLVNQRVNNYSNSDLVRLMADFKPLIVGLSVMTPFAHHLPNITSYIREMLPETLIVLGGPHVSSWGPDVLKGNHAHVAVPGEGEYVFEQIVRAYHQGDDLSSIGGIYLRDSDNQIIKNPGDIAVIDDLDNLPFPAYDLIDLPAHWRHQSMTPVPIRKYFSLFASRGCPYNCIYCHKIFGKRVRAHSADRIIAEIKFIMQQYDVNELDLLDDIFNYDKSRVFEFCDLLHKNDIKLKITFPNAMRTDLLNRPLIDALVDAGMYFCSFSLESGSLRIQKNIRRYLNIPKFLENVAYSVSKGVFANGFAMLGFPGETAVDMRQTIAVACQSRLHTISFYTVTPFPNTALYAQILKTKPEKLNCLDYKNMSYINYKGNLSEESDEVFFYYQRKANRDFYLHPLRLGRILKDFPQPHLLFLYAHQFFNRLTKGI